MSAPSHGHRSLGPLGWGGAGRAVPGKGPVAGVRRPACGRVAPAAQGHFQDRLLELKDAQHAEKRVSEAGLCPLPAPARSDLLCAWRRRAHRPEEGGPSSPGPWPEAGSWAQLNSGLPCSPLSPLPAAPRPRANTKEAPPGGQGWLRKAWPGPAVGSGAGDCWGQAAPGGWSWPACGLMLTPNGQRHPWGPRHPEPWPRGQACPAPSGSLTRRCFLPPAGSGLGVLPLQEADKPLRLTARGLIPQGTLGLAPPR